MEYEAPQIHEVGTVKELTQANLFGEQQDSLTWILPILGDDKFGS